MPHLPKMIAHFAQADQEELPLTMFPGRKQKRVEEQLALEAPPAAAPIASAPPSGSKEKPCVSTTAASAAANAAEETHVTEEKVTAKEPHSRTIDDMAEEILDVITPKQASKAKPAAKTAAEKPKAKQKAAPKKSSKTDVPKPEVEEPPKKKSKSALPFPGEGKRDPIRHGNVTIYICPNASSYRVKLAGERNDKAFSWKSEGAKGAWNRVREHVLKVAV